MIQPTHFGEDPRAREAIERFTQRVLGSSAPGTTYDDARAVAVTVAKRADQKFGRVDLDKNRKLSKHQAHVLIRESLTRVLLGCPRVQASVSSIQATMMRLNPRTMTDPKVVRPIAEGMVVSRLLETEPMQHLVTALFETLYGLKVKPEDGKQALAEVLNPEHVDEAAKGAFVDTSHPTPHYLPETLTFYPAKGAVLGAALDGLPSQDRG